MTDETTTLADEELVTDPTWTGTSNITADADGDTDDTDTTDSDSGDSDSGDSDSGDDADTVDAH